MLKLYQVIEISKLISVFIPKRQKNRPEQIKI